MSTDKPTSETTIAKIRERWSYAKIVTIPPDDQVRADVRFLLTELDRLEAKHESQLDDACAEMGEIRGCDKCDLCEDHHG